MMIILLILITLSLDSVWMLLGENCCWSLLGLKGFNNCETENGCSMTDFIFNNNIKIYK